MQIETARVSRIGIIIPPEEVRNQLHINKGTTLLRSNWDTNSMMVPPGSEILLVDFLIGNGEIVKGARTLNPTSNSDYLSPLRLFTNITLSAYAGIYMGTQHRGTEMDVFPLHNSLLTTRKGESLTVYEGLPGHPEYTWAKTSEIPAQALAESYNQWLDRRGNEIAHGETRMIPIPNESKGLKRRVLVAVNQAILNSAIEHTT